MCCIEELRLCVHLLMIAHPDIVPARVADATFAVAEVEGLNLKPLTFDLRPVTFNL